MVVGASAVNIFHLAGLEGKVLSPGLGSCRFDEVIRVVWMKNHIHSQVTGRRKPSPVASGLLLLQQGKEVSPYMPRR